MHNTLTQPELSLSLPCPLYLGGSKTQVANQAVLACLLVLVTVLRLCPSFKVAIK